MVLGHWFVGVHNGLFARERHRFQDRDLLWGSLMRGKAKGSLFFKSSP